MGRPLRHRLQVAPSSRPLSPDHSHLRKVCSFPTKSSHLRKVSFCAMSATTSVAAFSFCYALSHPPTGPAPFSSREGADRSDLSPSPSEFRYKPTCLGGLSRRPCPRFPSGRCRQKWHFSTTFSPCLLSQPLSSTILPIFLIFVDWKVPTEVTFRRHLLDFVIIGRPA